MVTGKILGAEALLRWTNPLLGIIAPDQFIPIAEESGLIVEIGEWILHQACAAIVAINQSRETPLTMAVNLSSRQFVRYDIYSRLVNCLQATRCDSSWITLEITESLLLQDSDDVQIALAKIDSMGIVLAIHDFGTGYSTLSYLNKFPIRQVKIDRSFAHDITTNKKAALLVKAIVAMAQSSNQELVAEGIETQEQANLLNSFGCHAAQGFLFSKPVLYAEFVGLLGQQLLASPSLGA